MVSKALLYLRYTITRLLPLSTKAGHPVGDQVGQAGHAFHKPVLAGPDALVVPHVPYDCIQDDLLHVIPQIQGQSDRAIVPQIVLLPF